MKLTSAVPLGSPTQRWFTAGQQPLDVKIVFPPVFHG